MTGIEWSLNLLERGQDIEQVGEVLDISGELACRRFPGAPYSLAENAAHAVVWQRHWLSKLGHGEPVQGLNTWEINWPSASPDEWPSIRAEFLEGQALAAKAAAGVEPGSPQEFALNQILIHNAYHAGQFTLLRRLVQPDWE